MMGSISDFSNVDIKQYEVLINLSWILTENGLTIEDLEITNNAPVVLMIDYVSIKNGPQDSLYLPGPTDWIGYSDNQPGVLQMDINVRLAEQYPANMLIQFYIPGAIPKTPNTTIFFFPGEIPQ